MLYNPRMAASSGGDHTGGGPSHGGRARRIVVVGCTGSGKTTTARSIAALLGVPHVELDAHNWEPDWTAAQTEVFRERVREAADRRRLGGGRQLLGGSRPGLAPRQSCWCGWTCRIELHRGGCWGARCGAWVNKEELWNGNREEFRTQFLSMDSLFIWQARTHGRIRRTIPEAIAQPEHAHLEVVTLRSARRRAGVAGRARRGGAAGVARSHRLSGSNVPGDGGAAFAQFVVHWPLARHAIITNADRRKPCRPEAEAIRQPWTTR